MDSKRAGRPTVYTREMLLDAAASVARRRASMRDRRLRLGDLLDVRLEDVLEEAGQLFGASGKRLSPPVMYRKWNDYNSFISDLVSHVFTPSKMEFSALKDSREGSWEESLRAYVMADQEQMSVDTQLWFSLFGGAATPGVAEALARVYQNYDEQVIPRLDEFLSAAGLELSVPTEHLARMLTALTEGFGLRQLVDPVDDRGPAGLWGEAAVALVRGLRTTSR